MKELINVYQGKLTYERLFDFNDTFIIPKRHVHIQDKVLNLQYLSQDE